MSVTAVAGVRLGTPAATAERRLRLALGRPDDSWSLPGCNGESGTQLRWGALHVVLSNEGTGPVDLRGWSVTTGPSRVDYVLPFGVEPGDRMQEALKRVPGAEGNRINEGAFDGYIVHVDRYPTLLWSSPSKDASGLVEEVSFHGFGCD